MRIVFLGPPGCGKGTQAKLISKQMNISYLSLGDALRESNDIEIKKFMQEGKLVPDEIAFKLVSDFINDKNSFLLDGFPRNENQALLLDNFLNSKNKSLDYVINIMVEDDIIIERLTSRFICKNCYAIYNIRTNPPKISGICDVCGFKLTKRDDDNEETIKKRLIVYYENTRPLIEFYNKKSILKNIDGSGSTEEVKEKILNLINSGKK